MDATTIFGLTMILLSLTLWFAHKTLNYENEREFEWKVNNQLNELRKNNSLDGGNTNGYDERSKPDEYGEC